MDNQEILHYACIVVNCPYLELIIVDCDKYCKIFILNSHLINLIETSHTLHYGTQGNSLILFVVSLS